MHIYVYIYIYMCMFLQSTICIHVCIIYCSQGWSLPDSCFYCMKYIESTSNCVASQQWAGLLGLSCKGRDNEPRSASGFRGVSEGYELTLWCTLLGTSFGINCCDSPPLWRSRRPGVWYFTAIKGLAHWMLAEILHSSPIQMLSESWSVTKYSLKLCFRGHSTWPPVGLRIS